MSKAKAVTLKESVQNFWQTAGIFETPAVFWPKKNKFINF
jgi:hypothetical protein